MSIPHPTVRSLIVCEDVEKSPDNPKRLTLVGLLNTIRSVGEPAIPLLYREIVVFVQLAECRGPAEARVVIRNADTDEVAFRTATRTVPFVNDPLEVFGVVFRIRDCVFAEAGLYLVEFWYNEAMIAHQPLLLRSKS